MVKSVKIVAMALVATLALVVAKGVVTGAWVPLGAAIFIGVTLGIVAAVLVATMRGGGRKETDKATGQPASPRVVAGWEARQPVTQAGTFAQHEQGPAPALIEPSRTAVVFLQQMPPAYDERHLSYFGGVPTAPRSFVWPNWTHDGKTEPLHFVMQVDCAAVPASARHADFPAQGVLYFFLDLRWGHSNGFRVLYAESADAFTPVPAPADLTVAYGTEARFAWRWTEALDEPATRMPKLLPKWPFDPMAIAIPPASIEAWRDELDAENQYPVFWWSDRGMDRVLLEAQEARRGAVPAEAKTPQAGFSKPYATYPQDWRAIEIGAGLLLAYVKRELRYAKGKYHLREMSAEDIQAMSERIGLEARQWLARAAGHAPFEATPEQTRDAFWSWLESWKDFAKLTISQSATLSIEAALAESAEAASRIPPEAIAHIDGRHALALRTETGIFASTPDRMLAPPSYVQGDQEEIAATHVLLLELSSDEGLGHHFGEGVYQFYITPADLRARRFDRTVLATSAY